MPNVISSSREGIQIIYLYRRADGLPEMGGLRLLTDPTFDPAGEAYPTGPYTLRKTAGPVLNPESLGRIDAVLLNHDHHLDNLDHAGYTLLRRLSVSAHSPASISTLARLCSAWNRPSCRP
jgi:L-ascorbate metabolism protein UlaG (beta-lactamase superfamily)